MQLRDAFPVGTALGACFVTGAYELRDGQKVVDLDRDLEDMPPWGRLCLHPEAVRQMCVLLGWETDPKLTSRVRRQQATITQLRAEVAELRTALSGVLAAGAKVGIEHPDLVELVEATAE